jgi:hypothetical protein
MVYLFRSNPFRERRENSGGSVSKNVTQLQVAEMSYSTDVMCRP